MHLYQAISIYFNLFRYFCNMDFSFLFFKFAPALKFIFQISYIPSIESDFKELTPEQYASYYRQADVISRNGNFEKQENSDETNSEDEKYMSLIKALRDRLKILAAKIEPKVYEYGFLKK